MARNCPPPGTGGAKPGAGRKTNEFIAQCAKLASSPKFLQWAADVLDGKPVETKSTMAGIVNVPASAGDRVYLWEKLAAYGFGKPAQPLNVEGDTKRIVLVFPSTVNDESEKR